MLIKRLQHKSLSAKTKNLRFSQQFEHRSIEEMCGILHADKPLTKQCIHEAIVKRMKEKYAHQ